MDLLGPDGAALGRVRIREAYRRLAERLEARLERDVSPASREDVTDGLDRLRAWSRRMVSGRKPARTRSRDCPPRR